MAIVTDSACALCTQPMHPGHGWAPLEGALVHIACWTRAGGITKHPQGGSVRRSVDARIRKGNC